MAKASALKIRCKYCGTVTDYEMSSSARGEGQVNCPHCNVLIATEPSLAALKLGVQPKARCGSCGTLKPISQFYKSMLDGELVCQSCANAGRRHASLTGHILADILLSREPIKVVGSTEDCADCGTDCDTFFAGGKVICSDCLEQTVYCDCCGITTNPDTMEEVYNHYHGGYDKWCTSCVEEHAHVCERHGCSTTYDMREGHAVCVDGGGTENWCPSCVEDNATKCHECGDYAESTVTVDGREWCESCFEDHGTTCAMCDCRTDNDNTRHVDDVGDVCMGCYENNCFTCERCENTFCTEEGSDGHSYSSEVITSHGSETWCDSCCDGHASTCPECECYVNSDDLMQDDEDHDEYICRRCYRERYGETDGSAIAGYHSFSKNKFRDNKHSAPGETPDRTTGQLLYLGFELEAGSGKQDPVNRVAKEIQKMDKKQSYYHMERDGSIPSHGFELISNPMTLLAHQAYNWKDILKMMRAAGMKSFDTGGQCGLHVHFTKAFLTAVEQVKLDMFVTRNKKFWERLGRRDEVSYSTFHIKSTGSYISTFEERAVVNSRDRYTALNFSSSCSSTIEFRLFCGTLNYRSFMATLEIVDAAVRWVKTRSIKQIHDNTGETDNFVAFVNTHRKLYANAAEFIANQFAPGGDVEPEPVTTTVVPTKVPRFKKKKGTKTTCA